MTVTGIVWFGRDFDWFDSWLAGHASELSQNLFLALLVHQIVVFPYGVTRSTRERVLVAAAYALALLAYVPSELSDLANTAFSAVAIALALAIVYLVVDRWLHATATERQALNHRGLGWPGVVVGRGIDCARLHRRLALAHWGRGVALVCAHRTRRFQRHSCSGLTHSLRRRSSADCSWS